MSQPPRAPVPPEAAGYDRYGVPRGVPFIPALLAALPPTAGARVLDLACGTGVIARAVAPAVGPGGLVLGVDRSPAMVLAARIRAAEDGCRNCRFAVADAHALALPTARFDAAYCQFGLMLFDQPPRAAAEIARVLRPGAACAAVVWSEPPRVVAFHAYLAAVEAQVPGVRAPSEHPVFSLAAPCALAALLADAGLAVERDERVAVADYHPDAATYWTWASAVLGFPVATEGGWTMRRILDYPPDLQAAVRADVLARVRAYEQPDGRLAIPSEAVLVRARRPGAAPAAGRST
jgi:SAM-dependent methyltransferase